VAWNLVRRHVQEPAELVADEAPGYDDLALLFPTRRNNHGQAFVTEPGGEHQPGRELLQAGPALGAGAGPRARPGPNRYRATSQSGRSAPFAAARLRSRPRLSMWLRVADTRLLRSAGRMSSAPIPLARRTASASAAVSTGPAAVRSASATKVVNSPSAKGMDGRLLRLQRGARTPPPPGPAGRCSGRWWPCRPQGRKLKQLRVVTYAVSGSLALTS
jgi:hypothetical protein